MTLTIKKATVLRKASEPDQIIYTFATSAYGALLLTSDGSALTSAHFIGQKNFPTISNKWIRQDDLEIFTNTSRQLKEYFKGERKVFDIRHNIKGTQLQEQVWQALKEIPFGTTASYKDIAQLIQRPKAARGIAACVAHNPLIVIIPCHRIIGSDKNLTGYAAGLELKQKLLQLETLYLNCNS